MSTKSEAKQERAGTVLVTGATSGFGAAIARRFAAANHRVIGTVRRKERLQALQEELDECLPLPLDARDRTAVEQGVRQSISRIFGNRYTDQ